jgi:hypothetical protein
MADIVCEVCGTDDHLSGSRLDDDTIELHCERCGATCFRDPRPTCPTCGGTDMEPSPRVILEKSRGSQMSIQGVQREFLCHDCDAELISARRQGHLPDRLPGSE